MSFYQAKTLIPGGRVGVDNKALVAVPDKNLDSDGGVSVRYKGELRKFNKKDAITYRVFEDKFRVGQTYKLIYFNWDIKKD